MTYDLLMVIQDAIGEGLKKLPIAKYSMERIEIYQDMILKIQQGCMMEYKLREKNNAEKN